MASTFTDTFMNTHESRLFWNADAPKRLKVGKHPGLWLEYQSFLAIIIVAITLSVFLKAQDDMPWWASAVCSFLLGMTVSSLHTAIRREGRWGLK